MGIFWNLPQDIAMNLPQDIAIDLPALAPDCLPRIHSNNHPGGVAGFSAIESSSRPALREAPTRSMLVLREKYVQLINRNTFCDLSISNMALMV